jgi:hypothetical protein
MRAALLALTAFATVLAINATPAAARDYPYCIKGKDWLSPVGDCSFTSYQQCLATASGRFAWCDTNPFYNSHNQMPRGGSRGYRRSDDRY